MVGLVKRNVFLSLDFVRKHDILVSDLPVQYLLYTFFQSRNF